MTTMNEEKVLNEQQLLDEEALYKPRPNSASITAETDGNIALEGVASDTGDTDDLATLSHDTAICLSGGGMRSASFSLGVLQGLAKAKVLEKSAYLSAVSGGNYTASWLTRWRSEVGNGQPWSQDLLEEKPENFSSRQSDLDPIRRLRSYSNYLAPRTGISKDSVAFAFSAFFKFSYNLVSWLLFFLTAAAFVRAVIALVAAVQTHLPAAIYYDEASGGIATSGKVFEADPTPLFVTPVYWTGASIRQLLNDPILFAALIPPLAILAVIAVGWLVSLVYFRSKTFEEEKVSRLSGRLWMAACAWFVTFVFFGIIPEYLWDVVTIQEVGGNFGFLSFALAISVSFTAIGGLWARIPKGVANKAFSFYDRLKAYSLELISLAMLAALAVTSGYVVRWIAQSSWFAPENTLYGRRWAWREFGEQTSQLQGEAKELGTQLSIFKGGWAELGAAEKVHSIYDTKVKLDAVYETVRQHAEPIWLRSSNVNEVGQEVWSELGVNIAERNSAQTPEAFEAAEASINTSVDTLSQVFTNITQFEINAYAVSWWWFWVLFAVLAIVTILFSEMAGANRSSLHSVYAARLTRAFLGTARNERRPPEGNQPDFEPSDDILLQSIRFDEPTDPGDPDVTNRSENRQLFPLFPVINMTLNIKGSRGNRQDWQERKAAPFIATPLHVGSELLKEDWERQDGQTPATGYARTEDLKGNLRNAQMSLGRAMAISGATASPNMGSYTRPIVSIAMAILNIRLGWWMRNPAQKQSDETPPGWLFSTSWNEPLYGVLYLFREAFGLLRDKDRWLYLSDGGHFDNVALYEMIRRECREILLIDSTFDPDCEYSDLLSTLRKIRVDFGVNIKLPSSLPGQEGEGKNKRFVIADIQYSDPDDPETKNGRLIILKPRLMASDPPELAQYREESRKAGSVFPQQSSLDQFYDETQFESYRMLGAVSAAKMLSALTPSLFSARGTEFNKHYPTAPSPDQDDKTSAVMATEARSCEAAADDAEPSAAPDPPGAPAARDNGALVTTLASVVQNIPTGELLLKAVGAVAATTLTVSVALDGTQALQNVALDAVDATTPDISPDTPAPNPPSPLGPRPIDPGLLEEIKRLRGDLKGADEILSALAKEETLGQVKSDVDDIKKALNKPTGGPVIKRIEGPDYSAQFTALSSELIQINQTMRDLNFITPGEFEAALARVQELENGGERSDANVNALQRQIDFLRRRLTDLATPGQ